MLHLMPALIFTALLFMKGTKAPVTIFILGETYFRNNKVRKDEKLRSEILELLELC